MSHSLPQLAFNYDALEPHIDAQTMQIHHTKHHQAYVDKLNAAIKGTEFESLSIESLLAQAHSLPESIKAAVINNGGGHANHSLFWKLLDPSKESNLSAALETKLNQDLGGLDAFKEAFANAAATRFGSGWAWLGVKDGKLTVFSTANQDSPLMDGVVPLIGLDVWEHAYYLNYQNRRPDYIAAFWNVLNWTVVSELFESNQ